MAASGIQAIDTPHPRNSARYHLTQQLLQNYHKEVRPVHDWTEATTVYLDVSFRAVLDVDAQNQKLKTSVWYREVWDDEFLSWNTSLFDDIREISLPLSAIWAPDIIINEFVDSERAPDLPYVYVNSSGTVKNSRPIQVVSACSLETYAFPFDVQNCSLTFNSILHTVEDVDLAFLRSKDDIKHDKKAFLNDSEWELLSVSSTYNILHSSTGDFAQIQFNVVIRRRPLLHIVNLLIPSIFLMLVDLGSFYLPPTCRARIVFKTSVLVGYTVFNVNMSDEMPRSTVSTPLIGVFFTVCMALLVLSLSKSIVLVKFLYDVSSSGKERPILCFRGNIDSDWPGMDPRTQREGVTDSPTGQEHQAQSGTLNEICSQLQPISNYFRTWDHEDQQEVRRLALLERFDRLLFQSYLVVLGLYAVTLCSFWVLWSGS
ncbi:PREDICTED: 5-hydroxytryptamine receptor 3B [Condylura cristata]|uniref:5-hydroxytryptamine receptor 3B n=1 Tax=Condylura cristata TaxID=143302 RepID=UPI000643B07E|nr:PREDICTED: 5-hydroxytryptamine receptor 3B [Condylura cristata]